jgi:hypothetical protein
MDLMDVAAVWSLLSVGTALVVCALLRGGHGEDVVLPAPVAAVPVPGASVPQPRQPAPSLQHR